MQAARRGEPAATARPPAQKRGPCNRPGYREAGIVPCDFHGLGQIRLVCLEKWPGAVSQPQPLSPDASRPAR